MKRSIWLAFRFANPLLTSAQLLASSIRKQAIQYTGQMLQMEADRRNATWTGPEKSLVKVDH